MLRRRLVLSVAGLLAAPCAGLAPLAVAGVEAKGKHKKKSRKPKPVTRPFDRPGEIWIQAQGIAAPYPAGLLVSGLAPGLVITKVTATLHQFAHTNPFDVSMLLVSPAGQAVRLFSNLGLNKPTVNATMTFDDEAVSVPLIGPIPSGTYRPTNYWDDDLPFPWPAPQSEPAGQLAAMNGAHPNGEWRLFIHDEFANKAGVVQGGLSLTITAARPKKV